MNVPPAFSPAAEKIVESRKLLGLCIALGVVIVLTATFIACSAILGTPWGPFGELLQWVATITGTHQAAQGASDWQKWRSGGGQSQYTYQPPERPGSP